MTFMVLGASSFFIAMIFERMIVTKLVLSVIIVAIVMWLYMNMSFVKSLLLSLLYLGLLYVADYICYLLSKYVFGDIVIINEVNDFQATMLLIIGKIILFIIVIVLKQIMGSHTKTNLRNSEWFRFIVFPVFTLFMNKVIAISCGVRNKKQG